MNCADPSRLYLFTSQVIPLGPLALSLSLFLYYNKQTFDCACRCKEEQGERPTERNKISPCNPTASRNTSYSPFPRENVPLVRSSPVQSSPVHGQSSLWSVRSMVSPVHVHPSIHPTHSIILNLSSQIRASKSSPPCN